MAHPEIIVERLSAYSQEDAAQIGLLMHELDPSFPAGPNERNLRDIIASPTTDEIVARDLGRIVGCATVFGLIEPAIRYAYVGGVAVDPATRGRGVGMGIMVGIEEWAREQDMSAIELQTEAERKAAIRLYLRAGYEPVTDGERVTRGLIFVKHLV